MQNGLVDELAAFAVGLQYEDIPEDVRSTASDALGDFAAVAVPGARSELGKLALAYLNSRSRSGRCVLFGTQSKMDSVSAGFFNATASHALDFDDTASSSQGHPTVCIAPAVFAVAQETSANGKDLIRAYVAGLEVMHQIARWSMPQTGRNGWHTTPVFGPFGAVAATANLRSESQSVTADALAAAASRSGGLRVNFGTGTKAFHAGFAVSSAMECLELASYGLTGSRQVFEGTDGFLQCFASRNVKEIPVCRLGTYWDLREKGLDFKLYPCCSGSHPAIDAVLDFLKETPISPGDVESIHCGVSLLSPKELVCHSPQNALEAKFSMEYALASAFIYGGVSLLEFTDSKVQAPEVQDFMRKVSISVDDELAKLGFIGYAPVKIAIRTKDGQEFFLRRMKARGRKETPFSIAEKKAKFSGCMNAAGIPSKLAGLWWEQLTHIEDLGPGDIAQIGFTSIQ